MNRRELLQSIATLGNRLSGSPDVPVKRADGSAARRSILAAGAVSAMFPSLVYGSPENDALYKIGRRLGSYGKVCADEPENRAVVLRPNGKTKRASPQESLLLNVFYPVDGPDEGVHMLDVLSGVAMECLGDCSDGMVAAPNVKTLQELYGLRHDFGFKTEKFQPDLFTYLEIAFNGPEVMMQNKHLPASFMPSCRMRYDIKSPEGVVSCTGIMPYTIDGGSPIRLDSQFIFQVGEKRLAPEQGDAGRLPTVMRQEFF
ncbi:MAG: hypothetical protein OXR66_08970 [Candidatus Woesearchaeota archaeon]|nr:hypothetical protein [Candidatus Woesearchaeota archaeon]